LFRLIHPLPPDPHPRYDYYDLSTELRPAPYLSSAVGPLQTLFATTLVGLLQGLVVGHSRLRLTPSCTHFATGLYTPLPVFCTRLAVEVRLRSGERHPHRPKPSCPYSGLDRVFLTSHS